jgi:type IV pilus assembly protein PilE
MNRQRGFTLIELMVVVAIIGILASIAYPLYGNYLIKGNRSAAQSHMLEVAQAQAQYFADNRAYAGSIDDLSMETPAAVSLKYDVEIDTSEGPPGFTITATPKAGTSQHGDSVLTINNSGTRSPADKW